MHRELESNKIVICEIVHIRDFYLYVQMVDSSRLAEHNELIQASFIYHIRVYEHEHGAAASMNHHLINYNSHKHQAEMRAKNNSNINIIVVVVVASVSN